MWPFNFLVTDTEMQVRLAAWVVRRIRLDDIEGVETTAGATAFLTWGLNEHWCNFWPTHYVVLRRRSGWVRSFIINPPDAEQFAAELKQRIVQTPRAF